MRPVSAPNELKRLKRLTELGIGPGEAQEDLNQILKFATSVFRVPTALVSLVESRETILAAKRGIEQGVIDRDISFCTHIVASRETLIVLDATLDDRFKNNPFVTGDAHVRFYAGAPLLSDSGDVLGSFCLIDTKPRNDFSACDFENLSTLASLALDKLEMRRLEKARSEGESRFVQIAATSPDGILCTNHEGTIRFWNHAAERLFGYTACEAEGRNIDIIVPDRMKSAHRGGLLRVANGSDLKLVGKTIELPARRKDGSEFRIELSLSMWRTRDHAKFGAIIRDISERKATEDSLHRLAHLDSLTQLPNRMVLRQRLEEMVALGRTASFIVLDLDGFKDVNDHLGHSAGDALLKEVALRLMTCVRSTDTVARIGGDEFAILLPDCSDPIAAFSTADKAIEALGLPFCIDSDSFNIGASAGVSIFPAHGSTAEEIFSSADLALYRAKEDGRGRRRFFDAGMRQSAILKRSLESELRVAHDNEEFQLFYQPQVVASTGQISGAEALLRWRHPIRGLQSPASFISTLETGMVASKVGTWVLRTACAQAASWRHALSHNFRIGVNLFGIQFRTGDLTAIVLDILEATGLPPTSLELEITENVILQHDDAMIRPLHQLREHGVGIAFDDYGTGYASLSQLKKYPITRLKIDQSFIRNVCTSPEDAAIVRAVLHLAKAFDIQAIAEGVETEEQRHFLLQEECEELQGYLFGKPLPAEDFFAAFGPTSQRFGARSGI